MGGWPNARACVCVCARVCARACAHAYVHAYVRARVGEGYVHGLFTFLRVGHQVP